MYGNWSKLLTLADPHCMYGNWSKLLTPKAAVTSASISGASAQVFSQPTTEVMCVSSNPSPSLNTAYVAFTVGMAQGWAATSVAASTQTAKPSALRKLRLSLESHSLAVAASEGE